ncbi:conserved hypothetical protein [Ricinus communis]|uniref:Uncharacterized protein n=1 Tax=Ricinus communis TaxID=3988 RepID=B9TDR2_RICCO|nr:conserved hypothetical protein [Ricinus communis]
MREVLDAAGINARQYDWFVSDIEVNNTPEGFSLGDQWMTGEELAHLVRDNDLQFIWAVFNAVPIGHRPNVVNAPYCEGNPDYWNGFDLGPQLNGALFEIACWDSSATIMIGLPEHAQRAFVLKYSDARPLADAIRT